MTCRQGANSTQGHTTTNGGLVKEKRVLDRCVTILATGGGKFQKLVSKKESHPQKQNVLSDVFMEHAHKNAEYSLVRLPGHKLGFRIIL